MLRLAPFSLRFRGVALLGIGRATASSDAWQGGAPGHLFAGRRFGAIAGSGRAPADEMARASGVGAGLQFSSEYDEIACRHISRDVVLNKILVFYLHFHRTPIRVRVDIECSHN